VSLAPVRQKTFSKLHGHLSAYLPAAAAWGRQVLIDRLLRGLRDREASPETLVSTDEKVFASVTDPASLSFDSDGNLFVGSGSSGAPVPIHRVSADGSTIVEFGPTIPDPDGVIVDI
jgi:hypothetical protein